MAMLRCSLGWRRLMMQHKESPLMRPAIKMMMQTPETTKTVNRKALGCLASHPRLARQPKGAGSRSHAVKNEGAGGGKTPAAVSRQRRQDHCL